MFLHVQCFLYFLGISPILGVAVAQELQKLRNRFAELRRNLEVGLHEELLAQGLFAEEVGDDVTVLFAVHPNHHFSWQLVHGSLIEGHLLVPRGEVVGHVHPATVPQVEVRHHASAGLVTEHVAGEREHGTAGEGQALFVLDVEETKRNDDLDQQVESAQGRSEGFLFEALCDNFGPRGLRHSSQDCLHIWQEDPKDRTPKWLEVQTLKHIDAEMEAEGDRPGDGRAPVAAQHVDRQPAELEPEA
mmetsp:Transcript_63/g.127  ORF Transcript_63/g.127 Transcript_63/m.127 type:complete len:245 (+) Transcript_63:491-1225(+)